MKARTSMALFRWIGASIFAAVVIACAAPEPVVVNSAEFGDGWPFHAGAATLHCGGPGAIWAEIDGQHYPLNALAPGWVAEKHPEITLSDLESAWRDDPNRPGSKADLGPVMDRALAICEG